MSTARFNTLQNAAGSKSVPVDTVVDGSAKAWVNFNGTFATSPFTVANGGIRAAFNVSSITDLGTGDYQINFATAMPDVNYVVNGSLGPADNMRASFIVGVTNNFGPTTAPEGVTKLTTSVKVMTGYPGTSSGIDWAGVYVAIFR